MSRYFLLLLLPLLIYAPIINYIVAFQSLLYHMQSLESNVDCCVFMHKPSSSTLPSFHERHLLSYFEQIDCCV
jgi:hypothetical protein